VSEGRPAWIRLLLLIYESDRLSVRWSPDDSDASPGGLVPDQAGLDPRELDLLARELQRQGLLKESDGRLKLTERGFRVAQRHYFSSVDGRSSDEGRKWLTLGILLVSLLTLIVAAAGQLGLSTLAITFLILVGVCVVVTVIHLAFWRDDTDESMLDTENQSVPYRTIEPEDTRESPTRTSEEEERGYESEKTENSEPEREETRED
jgi:hypothetical protein